MVFESLVAKRITAAILLIDWHLGRPELADGRPARPESETMREDPSTTPQGLSVLCQEAGKQAAAPGFEESKLHLVERLLQCIHRPILDRGQGEELQQSALGRRVGTTLDEPEASGDGGERKP